MHPPVQLHACTQYLETPLKLTYYYICSSLLCLAPVDHQMLTPKQGMRYFCFITLRLHGLLLLTIIIIIVGKGISTRVLYVTLYAQGITRITYITLRARNFPLALTKGCTSKVFTTDPHTLYGTGKEFPTKGMHG